MNAISGRLAPTITPPARSSRRAGPKSGCHLAGVQPTLQLARPAAPEERRPSTRRELAVEEDRQRELVTDPARKLGRARARAAHVLRDDRHDRNDVRRADPRMRAFVGAQVDAFSRDSDACYQRTHELVLRADEREHRAVVVLVRVDVEQPGAAGERPPIASITERSRPSEKFGTDSSGRTDRRPLRVEHRFQWGARTYSRRVKEYYDTRAPEYDDWYLGLGRFDGLDRPRWDDDVRELERTVATLQPKRTLDVACGTGFLTRQLRGDITGLDQSARMLEIAQERSPEATFVRGDALELPFPDKQLRPRLHRPLLRPPRAG